MTTSSKKQDHCTHHLISFSHPPPELVALREELAFHPDISSYAAEGKSFEECLGRIGVKLDIALDGDYDAANLCGVLVEALRNRRFFPREPERRATGLIAVELIETADSLTLETAKRDWDTQGTVIKEIDTTGSSNADGLGQDAESASSEKSEIKQVEKPGTYYGTDDTRDAGK